MPWKCKQCETSNADKHSACKGCKELAPKIELFEADTKVLSLGQAIRLEWDVLHATQIEIDGEQVEARGMWKLEPKQTTVYTLVASNGIAKRKAEFEVSLAAPEIEYFTVAETNIQIGFASILHWGVKNAAQIFIDRGVGEVSGQSFTEAFFDRAGPLTLRAINPSGEVSKSLDLALPLPEILSFYAPNPVIRLGEGSFVNWEVSNASEVFIDQEVGNVTGENRTELFPDRTTTYTLTAKNHSGEVKKSLDLTLPPPKIIHFGAENELVTEGKFAVLTWNVENAYQLSIDHEVGDVTDKTSVRVKPNETLSTFILTAIGHSGETKAAVDLSIFPIPMKENLFETAPDISTDIPLDNENFNTDLPDATKGVDLQLSFPDLEEQIKSSNGKGIDLEFYQKMELTDNLLELKKPSLRKEIARIYTVFKHKISPKHKH